jgi:hypothetical protein
MQCGFEMSVKTFEKSVGLGMVFCGLDVLHAQQQF